MDLPSEAQALRAIRRLMMELLHDTASSLDAKLEVQFGDGDGTDLVVRARGIVFVVDYKSRSDAAVVARAVERACAYATRKPKRSDVRLLAVPHMGAVGRNLCERAGIGWLDLSGNAHIVAPGVFVHVEGKPNRFTRPGRPSTVFAPRSSRIVRHLLIHPAKAVTQRELARATGVGEGFTSRIVRRLEEDGYVTRDSSSGAVAVTKPALLLEEWSAAYDFSKHQIQKGHLSARSAEEMLRRVAESLAKAKLDHAVTGLGAAWLMTHFAGFRLVTVFVADDRANELLAKLGWREEPRGANLWLVVPNDEGVFQGANGCEGVRCVHPVQAYVDLKAHPERAADAAKELRGRLLKGLP